MSAQAAGGSAPSKTVSAAHPTTGTASSGNWRSALVIAVLVGAVAAWVWFEQTDTEQRAELPEALRDEPDLYINDAVIHQFRADGSRNYLLHAKTVNHFDDQQLTRMEQPDLLLETRPEETADARLATDLAAGATTTTPVSDTAPAPWHATSDYGYVRKRPNPDGVLEEVVFLRQNVELSREQTPPRYLSLRTTTLYLYPDREYVETDESVTIDTHTGRTKASGMRGYLNTGVLRLVGDKDQPNPTQGDKTQVQTIVLPFQFK